MRVVILLMVILCVPLNTWAASQKEQVRQANAFFKKKQWDQAVDSYLNALEHSEHADIVQYDLGTAFYKKGNYDQAIEHLQKGISDQNKELTAKAQYNSGNAFYQKSLSLEKEKLDDSINLMQKSIESYDKTLQLNPQDQEATFNRELAQKQLERLKKKKEEQEQQKKDSSKQDKSSKNNQDDQKNQSNQDHEKNQSQDSVEEQKKQEDQKKQEEQKAQQNKEQEQKKAQENKEEQALPAGMQEAKELLEEYERQDTPKGLLNFVNRHQGESHVERDW